MFIVIAVSNSCCSVFYIVKSLRITTTLHHIFSSEKLQKLIVLAYEELDTPAGLDQCYASVEHPFFYPLWNMILAVLRFVVLCCTSPGVLICLKNSQTTGLKVLHLTYVNLTYIHTYISPCGACFQQPVYTVARFGG